MKPYDHPAQKQLHEEVHARPPIAAPVAAITFLFISKRRRKRIIEMGKSL